ncbi:MAG: hypothetical protein ACJ763_03430 [Bdellovibrionia bacterium]
MRTLRCLRQVFLCTVLLPLLLLLASAGADCAPVKNATYEEFQSLVRESVAKVPDLNLLWRWQVKGDEPVYFGGGGLRGLLRWLEYQLRNKSVAQVRALRVPNVDQLISVWADKDIYHDRVDANWFKSNFPAYGDWDVLTRTFYDASIEAGGPGIEKIRVSPTHIDDPLGGLAAFYQGKLNFVDAPEEVFQKFRGASAIQLKDNYKSALVLRALRFSRDLPSVTLDDETLRAMKAAVKSEENLIKANNYWLQKSLYKLYLSTGENRKKTIQALDSVGLTKTLARNGYYLNRPNADGWRHYLFLEPRVKGLTIDDLTRFKLSVNSIAEIAAAMEKMLRGAKAEDVDAILDPVVRSPTPEYLLNIAFIRKSKTSALKRSKVAGCIIDALAKDVIIDGRYSARNLTIVAAGAGWYLYEKAIQGLNSCTSNTKVLDLDTLDLNGKSPELCVYYLTTSCLLYNQRRAESFCNKINNYYPMKALQLLHARGVPIDASSVEFAQRIDTDAQIECVKNLKNEQLTSAAFKTGAAELCRAHN